MHSLWIFRYLLGEHVIPKVWVAVVKAIFSGWVSVMCAIVLEMIQKAFLSFCIQIAPLKIGTAEAIRCQGHKQCFFFNCCSSRLNCEQGSVFLYPGKAGEILSMCVEVVFLKFSQIFYVFRWIAKPNWNVFGIIHLNGTAACRKMSYMLKSQLLFYK